MPDPLFNTRRIALKAVARADDFQPLTRFEDVPAGPYLESRSWSTRIFQPARGYGDARAVIHSWRRAPNHASYDFLRHGYPCWGVQLVVTESRVFVHIAAPAHSTIFVDVENPAQRATNLASHVLKVPAPPTFVPIKDDGCTGHFTTSMAGPLPKLRTWNERIDAVVDGDSVVLLIYKVRPDSDPAVNAADWFPRKAKAG